MPEALAMVRRELGPDASVLHTREVTSGVMRWLGGSRQIEVLATNDEVDIPSRLDGLIETEAPLVTYEPAQPSFDPRNQFRQELATFASSGVELTSTELATAATGLHALHEELLAAEWPGEFAYEYTTRLGTSGVDEATLAAHLANLVESDLPICRPIHLASGEQRIVALVGPTGVGKTTTIAKLAANFRLKQQQRVGMITVDTYRIAAVEQLRTYAEIINVPMEVVSTPREMRDAVRRLRDLDLLLIDTAGRSPRDELKLQELRAMLGEAQPDEVHLVLSATASANSLVKSAEQFAGVGTTALTLTKLDESHGLGCLLPLLRTARLPLSYLTHGQNVPQDIVVAERRPLARAIVGLSSETRHA